MFSSSVIACRLRVPSSRMALAASSRQADLRLTRIFRQEQEPIHVGVAAASATWGRNFSTNPEPKKKQKQKKKNENEKDDESEEVSLSYFERKKLAKEKRRAEFFKKKEIQQRRRLRRVGKPKGVMKNAFREWWSKRVAFEEMHDRRARRSGLDWKIQAAALVERIPIILPDKEDWEIEFEELELELSQYGKQYPEEFYEQMDPDEEEEESKVGYSDEDIISILPEGFTPAPRETEADLSGDVRTIDRKLKTFIYLTVRQNADSGWTFPTAALLEDETIVDASKRALKDAGGGHMDLYIGSNCPMAVKMGVFSDEEQKTQGYYGTKTFFMGLQHIESDVIKSNMKADDFAWLDKDEVIERMGDPDFHRFLL